MSGIFDHHCFLGEGLSLNLKFINSPRLSGQLISDINLPLSTQPCQLFYLDSGDSNSYSHA